LEEFWTFHLNNTQNHRPKGPIFVHCIDFQTFNEQFLFQFQMIPAAGGLVTCLDRTLFIRRNGRWDLPKGWIEEGEKAEEAALREVREETGVSGLSIARFLSRTNHTYMEGERKILKQTDWFLMNTLNPDRLVPQYEEGISEVRWFRTDEWHILRKDTFDSINEVLSCYESSVEER